MKIGKIDKSQAEQFAYSFVAEIPRYIEAHKFEYISWLAKNGLHDDTNKISETDTGADK